LTENKRLRAVLAGSNLLYAGEPEKTPFYVHALSVNSFIESSYRCADGGSQITKLLIRRFKENGGDAFKHQEVTRINVTDKKAVSVTIKTGQKMRGDLFISNIDPKSTLNLTEGEPFRKSFTQRIEEMESTISAFSIHIVLKPKSFKYLNHNYYHSKDLDAVWNGHKYTQENWPLGYMVSMGVRKNQDAWGEQLTAIVYMRFEEVIPWAKTFNTVADKNDRGETYLEFKKKKTEIFLKELEKKFPNIRECIQSIHASTPLSYRDYIGCHRGSMYGYAKDVENPLKSFIAPRTKMENLYFTGQSLNMHGILGVTISGVVTCSEILGAEYLLDKIVNMDSKLKEKKSM
jgi:all-trans-retinol 13,14-reductase